MKRSIHSLLRCILAWALASAFVAKSAEGTTNAPPRYTLQAAQAWQLNLPDEHPFDASGLLRLPDGQLLTVSDKEIGLYRIDFKPETNAADLVRWRDCFTREQLAPFKKEKKGRYDCEGIARDDEGRLYLCEEANRWILRFDPQKKTVERLDIDWSPVQQYFDPGDDNASFEGIAIGNGRLYVANERKQGRLIVVDLATLRVVDDFKVKPAGAGDEDITYSDLCFLKGDLWVLLREHRLVLRVKPDTHAVLAEFHYGGVESDPEYAYRAPIRVGFKVPFGLMEGLAVDDENIWLCTDNNGLGRIRAPEDHRPTVFRCVRPDTLAK